MRYIVIREARFWRIFRSGKGDYRSKSDFRAQSRQRAGLLSIRTVFPRQGGRVWYDDQREAHRQIYTGDDVVDYAFTGTDPNSADNRLLLDAMQQQIPVIYFLGTSPGRYQPIIPTFIVGWHPERLRVELAFGSNVPLTTRLLCSEMSI